MSQLQVTDTTVPSVLENLMRGEWLVPKFQREFVWSTDQVSGLVQSILDARPIGMVTLWEQQSADTLELERISIQDQDPETKKATDIFFGPTVKANKTFALLDGRQRCTAIAMAFGGFKAAHGLYRYSGRYFLDVTQNDPRERVKYFKEADVRRRKLDIDSNCFGQGLFPLASNVPGEALLSQWMRYLQALKQVEYYKDGALPSISELDRRNRVLQQAFEGIVQTKLAVYIVPEKYGLADICDIFETLNTTGTQVSTVDLIHSWLYSDTRKLPDGPFLLRDWLDDLGDRTGAIGWSSSNDRPELTAQLVTACYVGLSKKEEPRKRSGLKVEPIISIKSGDLLATPSAHWLHLRENVEVFAECIGQAQLCVADGYFPWSACPYPASIGIYVGLKWQMSFEPEETKSWAAAELNAIFRAFFWRNAVARRYDQGFLTKVGSDLNSLRNILKQRPNYETAGEWASFGEVELSKIFDPAPPSKAELIDRLTSSMPGGALQKALTLPLLARVEKDFVDPNIKLAYPGATPVELHHIFPRAWLKDNNHGVLATILAATDGNADYPRSVANLTPLSRKTNNEWKAAHPAAFLASKKYEFDANAKILEKLFINKEQYDYLLADLPKNFWDSRAELIADWIVESMQVTL
ncbi:MAG: DUF262 domain-containing protein [Pseudomonadota bacterium]|nr:DUF262 domain-containing protein [Pseudomonadota bacterium]